MTSAQAAREMRVPVRTVRVWLAAWLALGVEGIRETRSRGRYGKKYLVTSSLIERWRNCDLPCPQPSARAA